MAIGFPPSYELIVSSEISKEEFSQKSLMAFEKLQKSILVLLVKLFLLTMKT